MSKKQQAATSLLRLMVPATKAAPTPPIGPALGQRGVKAIDFCKQFNTRTADLVPDTPVPVLLTVHPDRSFTFVCKTPPTAYLLKKAAGIDKGSANAGSQIVGQVSLKHVYEIGKIKQMDEALKHIQLEKMCKSIVASARSIGINIVP
jgi:large subunit ribosomal protein L11